MAEEIQLEDGKYTVISDRGNLMAKRYGEPWRDLTGDNLVHAMFSEIQRLAQQRSDQQQVEVAATRGMRRSEGQYDPYTIDQLDRGILRISELVVITDRDKDQDQSEQGQAYTTGQVERHQRRRANLLELQWHLRVLRKHLTGKDPLEEVQA